MIYLILFGTIIYIVFNDNWSFYIITSGISFVGMVRFFSKELEPYKDYALVKHFIKPWLDPWHFNRFFILLYHVALVVCISIFFYRHNFLNAFWGVLILAWVIFMTGLQDYRYLGTLPIPSTHTEKEWKKHRIFVFLKFVSSYSFLLLWLIYINYS